MDGKNSFKLTMATLSAVYDKAVTQEMLKAYWMMLGEYPSEVIDQAARRHMKDTKSGQYFPKPADFMRYIDGAEITADMIIAMAKMKDCPLGVISAIHIGSYDLANLGSFDLRQRANECVLLLPQWKDRARVGSYTDHELSIMIKYNVDPCSPFSNGLNPPENKEEISSRVARVIGTDRHKLLLEPPYVETVDGDGLSAEGIKMLADIGKIHDK